MLNSIKELLGYNILGTDGKVGDVEDFYFDDQIWVMRYIVAGTGSWLSVKNVLLSPHSVVNIDRDKKEIHFNLIKEKIKNSPSADTDKPVSRQHETELASYYGWPTYWMGNGMQPSPAYIPVAPIPPANIHDEINKSEQEPKGDPNLRSSSEVIGYTISALDDTIGHVENFIFDTDNWTIKYVVVATRNFLPGKKVLIALPWIKSISWEDSSVKVDLKKEQIVASPVYDPDKPIDKDYEAKLFKHYDRNIFW